MASEVGICNQAILDVGGNPITSFQDDSIEARVCRTSYADSRDHVLEDAAWSFAIGRSTLSPDALSPEFGYSSRFKIPSDCLRVLQAYEEGNYNMAPNPLQWEREGEYILADATSIQVRYIKRITDPNKFSPSFIKAMVYYMASVLAIPVQASRALQETKLAIYNQTVDSARTTDGMQGRTKIIRSSRLTNIRNM